MSKHGEMEAIRMVDDLSLVYYTMDSIIQAKKKQIEEAMQEVAMAKDEVEEATKLVQNTIHEAEKKEAANKEPAKRKQTEDEMEDEMDEAALKEAMPEYVAKRRRINE